MNHYRKQLPTGRAGYWLVLIALLVLAGCTNTAPPLADEAPPEANDYRIGAGDTLNIHVRDNPDLSMQVPVRPDGRISIPLVEEIKAADKTPVELAEDLETALSEYVRNPLVTVIVTNFVGVYNDQVRVVGEAAQPRSIPYRSGMTLLDLMIDVGGLTRFADGNRAKLVRTIDGERRTYGIRIQALLNGDIDANVALRPGDVVIVPQTFF